MRELKACGVLVFNGDTFLLMTRPNGYDLPKGHIEPDESELDCALRELEEETGIQPDQIKIDPSFRYSVTYYSVYQETGELIEKTTVIFVGFLQAPTHIRVKTSEHNGFEWLTWHPPHIIQRETINGLMAAIEQHYADAGRPSQWLRGW